MEKQQKSDGGGLLGCCTVAHYIYSIFLFIMGLGLIGVGMWMGIDKDVRAYLVVFRRDSGDELLTAGWVCFIVVGLILVGIGVLGWIGAMKRNSLFMMLFIAALVGVFIIEVTIGFCVLTFRDQIHQRVKGGMIAQIHDEYTWDNEVGKSWNRIQVRHRCCGADGSWDYTESDWFWSQNPGILEPDFSMRENKLSAFREETTISSPNDAEFYVPDSCCRLEYNEDRDPGKVDPQNPTPKDRPRCNEDAAGRKNDDNYLHGRGCYAALLDFIYIHLYILMGGSIIAGLMQIFGITIAALLLCAIRDSSDPLL